MIKLYKNKEWLYKKYISEKLSTYKIAEICKCSTETIRKWLKKYKIKVRTRSEAKTGEFSSVSRPLEDRLWKKIDKKDNISDCWFWIAGCSSKKYGSIIDNGKLRPAHVVAYELFYKVKVPKNYIVHHMCKNKKCCNPFHLLMMTKKEHELLHSKEKQGEKNFSVKLKEWQVLKIRAKYATGKYTQKELAKEYNVSISTISFIVNRKTWEHI